MLDSRVMPTWARVTVGFLVPVVGYTAWGAYVLHAIARADAAQRADPDPAPDAAGIPTGLSYLLPTFCLACVVLAGGALMCVSRRLRPYGIGVLGGVAIPVLMIAVSCLVGVGVAHA